MLEIPISVLPQFKSAGWHPHRRRSVPANIPVGHPAAEVLAQCAGLTVGCCGAGLECATSDIQFQFLPREPDDTYIELWAKLLDAELVGIAEVHHSHGELYIDAFGRCFGRSCVSDDFYLEGATFGDAVVSLLVGRRPRPMLRPDQESVTLFDEQFTATHPSVFRYRESDNA